MATGLTERQIRFNEPFPSGRLRTHRQQRDSKQAGDEFKHAPREERSERVGRARVAKPAGVNVEIKLLETRAVVHPRARLLERFSVA